MLQSQFDPDLGVLLNGEFRSVTVLDPALPGHVPNLVLDPTKDFQVEVNWRLNGTEVPPAPRSRRRQLGRHGLCRVGRTRP